MISIIPAIDLIGGKCVRLVQGDYVRKTEYDFNPVDLAKQFEDAGINRLHLVDLDGAKRKELINIAVLENICTSTKLSVDYGGGITKQEDLDRIFNAGADYAVIGSLAVHNPDLVYKWLERFGNEKIIIGADVKNQFIAVNAWRDTSELNLIDFIADWLDRNAKYFLCTDVEKDGMLAGSSVDLYRQILTRQPVVRLIASGGVSSLAEIKELEDAGIHGAIIGRALFEGKLTLPELSIFL
ncbi:MAG: 1-(5-phosphoribosyl)-5-[(5-phosphoribosylamino)methylideneamino]imidazole-4-carboxamide isomerase [Bacteroidales bacterium]